MKNFIAGLQLIQKYKPAKKSDYHGRPEHDEFWAGSLDWKMNKEDEHQMEKLGWIPDEDVDGWRARF